MKNYKFLLLAIIIILITVSESKSYAPQGKNFGIGLMLGEPTGLTIKLWSHPKEAFAISIANSYLGNLRLGLDYLWHFNAFNSNVVNLYAGPGVAVGIGDNGGWWYKNNEKLWYKNNDDIGLGVRAVFGMNLVPRNSPLEFFGEFGFMFGFMPGNYTNIEGAFGIRYYF